MSTNRRSPLFALFLTVFVDLLGFGLFLPSLAYLAGQYGASKAQIGLLQTSFSLAQFLFAPFWGWLSDRIGRRPVMLLSIAGGGLSYLMFGLGGSLPLLFVARTLSGGFAANISTAQAYVADVTTPENRAKGMGLIGAAFGLGFTLGPPLGGFVAGNIHYERPAFLAAALCGINLVWAFLSLPESHSVRMTHVVRRSRFKALAAALSTPRLAGLIVLFFVVTFAFANLEQALVLATWQELQWGPRQNGELLGFVGILMVLVQGGLIGRLSKRFGERNLLIAGTVAMGVALLFLAGERAVWCYWLAMIPLAVGNSLTNPSLTSLLSRAAPAAERGSTLGVSQSASSLARILAPMWAGWSLEKIAVGAPFATGGVIMLVGTVLALGLPAIMRDPVGVGVESAPPV